MRLYSRAPARATRLFGNHNKVTGHEVTAYLGPFTAALFCTLPRCSEGEPNKVSCTLCSWSYSVDVPVSRTT